MSNLNVGMLRMHELFFLERWVEMGLWGTNVCIFVGGKEHILSKDSNDNIVHWRAKKPSILSEINSDTNILWSIASGVWIIVSFLKSPSQPCLVSSRNGHSPRLLPVFHQRQNQNYSLTAGCLKITIHMMMQWEVNWNSLLSQMASHQRHFAVSNNILNGRKVSYFKCFYMGIKT